MEYIEKYNETNDHSKNRQLIDEFYTSKVIASQFEKIYKELDVSKLTSVSTSSNCCGTFSYYIICFTKQKFYAFHETIQEKE